MLKVAIIDFDWQADAEWPPGVKPPFGDAMLARYELEPHPAHPLPTVDALWDQVQWLDSDPDPSFGADFRRLCTEARQWGAAHILMFANGEMSLFSSHPHPWHPPRLSEAQARQVVRTFLAGVLGSEDFLVPFPDEPFHLVEDGENGWAFFIEPDDTTSYLHCDLAIEWYGTS